MLIGFNFFKSCLYAFGDSVIRLLLSQSVELSNPIVKVFVFWIIIFSVASASAAIAKAVINFSDFHNVCFAYTTNIAKNVNK